MSNGFSLAQAERPAPLPRTDRSLEHGSGSDGLPALIAHEFRTPLAIIDGAAQLLEMFGHEFCGRSKPEAFAELAKIHRAVNRLRSLVDSYLVEDRVGDAALPFRPVPVDVEALAAGVCRNHTRLSGRIVDFRSSGPGEITGDPELLRVLFDNLVINALKFSPPTAPVTVTVSRLPGRIEVAVADRGIGIADSERDRIFDKYFRGETVGGMQGIGLGLYLVRRILDMHGGTIRLQSAAGRGSIFTVDLPADGSTSTSR